MKNIIIIFLILVFKLTTLAVAQQGGGSDYRLAVNDLLEISVYEELDLSKTVRVDPNGSISFPLLGNMTVIGLTAKELEAKITGLLEKDYLINPQVSVFIKEHAKIYVSGQVDKPGAYEMRSGLTVMEAVTLAGGFIMDKANTRKIKLSRAVEGGKQIINIDFEKIIEGKEKDINLLPGDEVRVEELGIISVLGQVKNPGRFTLKKDLTVLGAIALAGGITDLAAANGTKVIRIEDKKKRVIVVPVDSILKGGDKSRDIFLEADDTVVIPESFF